MIRTAVLTTVLTGMLAIDAAAEPVFFRYCSGAVLRMTPGTEAGHYDLSVASGPDWSAIGHVRLDPEGRFLGRQIGAGGETRFAPHNCEKVPGLCEYTETAPDGTETQKIRINGREPDGSWSYSILEDTTGEMDLAVVGTVFYGLDGLAETDTWTTVDGYEKSCAERIDPPDQP
ncbi:MAG: hypothetical protein AAF317_04295 [Pseudomonadota bacterium]